MKNLLNKIPCQFSALLAAASALLALSSSLHAVTYTWTQAAGTGNANQTWSTTNNWFGSPNPLTFNNTTDIVFDNASVVNRANALAIGTNRTIRSITINANYATANNASFDIQTYATINTNARTLTFAADSGNASINVAQSTSGTVQVRIGNNTGGNVILNSNLDIAQNNTFFNASGLLFDGVVSGARAINKTGAGVVSFNRNNANWSGGMNINDGTVTVVSNPGAMGTGAWTLGGGANNTTFLLGSTQVFSNSSGLVVAVGDGTRTIANVGLSPASGIGNPTFSGNITLNKDATVAITQYTATTHDSMTLSGAVTGAGGIVKAGTGFLILSNAANSFGGLQIDAGQVTLQTNATVTGLSGSGGSLALAGGTLTVNAAASSSYGQVISGAGALTKSGGGTMTLGGTNTYGGATTVSAGSLIVNGNQSGATGVLNVLTNATLGGSGTIGGATTISGIHSPGNSAGVQTFNSGLAYATGSTFVWELFGNTAAGRGTSFDGVDVTGGTLTINTGVTSSLVFNGSESTVLWSDGFWDSNQTWLVFDNASTPSILGIPSITIGFDSLGNDFAVDRAGSTFAWDLQGNDVYLNYVVPEPSTYALLALAAAGLGAHVVRRRRNNR
jgi:fibronectin-binding autotransporter adhesin